jgi:L-ascorbate oxidase
VGGRHGERHCGLLFFYIVLNCSFENIMYLASTIGVLLAIVHSVVGQEPSSNATPADDDRLHKHDGSFVPDFYLSVTYENHTVACQHRMSVLVNGTSPGPTIHLTPGKTSWVRVCNDMDMYNTTMVRINRQLCIILQY